MSQPSRHSIDELLVQLFTKKYWNFFLGGNSYYSWYSEVIQS